MSESQKHSCQLLPDDTEVKIGAWDDKEWEVQDGESQFFPIFYCPFCGEGLK